MDVKFNYIIVVLWIQHGTQKNKKQIFQCMVVQRNLRMINLNKYYTFDMLSIVQIK